MSVKSQKAKEYIKNHTVMPTSQVLQRTENMVLAEWCAEKAVELAEQEMIGKAVEAFQMACFGLSLDDYYAAESIFINQLNKEDKNDAFSTFEQWYKHDLILNTDQPNLEEFI